MKRSRTGLSAFSPCVARLNAGEGDVRADRTQHNTVQRNILRRRRFPERLQKPRPHNAIGDCEIAAFSISAGCGRNGAYRGLILLLRFGEPWQDVAALDIAVVEVVGVQMSGGHFAPPRQNIRNRRFSRTRRTGEDENLAWIPCHF